MKSLFLASTLMFATGAAHAGGFCPTASTEVFSCTFKGGAKAVSVCLADGNGDTQAIYGFYKTAGGVEKEITRPMAEMTATPWNGIGNFISESVTFEAGGGYAYEVWWGAERSNDSEVEGGILVLENGAQIAALNCDGGSVDSDLSTLVERIEIAQ
ncbi:hypothetical protein [Rhodovulum sp. FJ3]|uniref:hypothetical protein n=1 Tax=Rhodovulum sp. FJ3 TaxID=3079053 RepID=UPI00293DF329|nr:hypothetical protein [Rhodovulum sp. FJ3]MDV4168160.1 hypothetical protein [Rhodovulum sp. FJ3]